MSNEAEVFGFAEATLDKAGRYMMPADIFTAMGGRKPMRITVELQGRYLELRTEKNFNNLVERIREMAPDLPSGTVEALMMDYLGYSLTVQVDSHFRLTVPKKLREVLGEDNLILVGVGDALQIWGRTAFMEGRPERRAALSGDVPGLTHAIYGLPRARPLPKEERVEPAEPDA